MSKHPKGERVKAKYCSPPAGFTAQQEAAAYVHKFITFEDIRAQFPKSAIEWVLEQINDEGIGPTPEDI